MHCILPSARAAALSAVIASAGLLSAAVLAQNTPGGTTRDNSGLNGSLSREDLEKLGGDRRGVPPDVVQGTPESRAKVRARSDALANALELPCEVRAAAPLAA